MNHQLVLEVPDRNASHAVCLYHVSVSEDRNLSSMNGIYHYNKK